jgi:hypothetical protein
MFSTSRFLVTDFNKGTIAVSLNHTLQILLYYSKYKDFFAQPNSFLPFLLHHLLPSQSQSYITTDGQSASLSWNKAPIWGLRPDLCYCQTVAGLLIWGALSDERTGLSFTIAAGRRQRSHFRVRVP